MTKARKDIGESVRARLHRLADERSEDFQLLLVRYANERLLYRLANSPHSSHFVLKGAALFTVWTGEPHRATRDVDLLGFGEPTEQNIRSVFAEVLSLDVQDDGIRFDGSSMMVEKIREEQEYGGVRVLVVARITNAKIRLQVDVGFGDVITPAAVTVDFPTLLDFPAPKLRAYPRETVIAEKLEAMVKLGQANSRMKDFYDIAVLSQTFAFDGETLVRAIQATFHRRGTPLPLGLPLALTAVFIQDKTKITQWGGFMRKSGAPNVGDLASVGALVAGFVQSPLGAALASHGFAKRWKPGGGWK
jgi:predicted nucleotidyltransferase component of viral defense system